MNRRAGPTPFLAAALAFSAIAFAQFTSAADVDRAVVVFEKILPSGWSVAERKMNEYPWGHHFCDDYHGPMGTKVTAVGPSAVSVVWVSRIGEKLTTPVATESLEVWFMPPEYKDSSTAWLCSHRPIQPIAIATSPRLGVFGRPSHRIKSEEEFRREVLDKAQFVSWPESPEHNRSKLSWSTWERDMAAALRKEFAQ